MPTKPSPSTTPDVTFCATSRSGLGHLRRSINIAAALRKRAGPLDLRLLTNGPAAGLDPGDRAVFDAVREAPRAEMAAALDAWGAGPVVVDTAVVPGIERLSRPLVLVLRETVASRLARFRLAGGRRWDRVVVPNPPDWWMPPAGSLPGSAVEAVGWIYRRPPAPEPRSGEDPNRPADVLIASGGGGTAATAEDFRRRLAPLLRDLRARVRRPIRFRQALGPRSPAAARLEEADEVFAPGADLDRHFAAADLVITTVGYNSVLELASLDVPVLLVPIPRTYDDQEARARRWADALGFRLGPEEAAESAAWAASVLESLRRRPPADLGPSGAARAAEIILEAAG